LNIWWSESIIPDLYTSRYKKVCKEVDSIIIMDLQKKKTNYTVK